MCICVYVLLFVQCECNDKGNKALYVWCQHLILFYHFIGQGPKYVKIFINLPRSMDFEEAERSEPTQALELTEDDIKEDGIVPLRYVKFQNVNSVTVSSISFRYI